MALQLYDTYTRSVRPFVSMTPGQASLYACGPTVYHYAHLGNLRTYLFEDVLRRTLELNEYTVNHVVNITDVGHLTSDADTGDDKMEAASKKTGKSAWDIAAFYTAAFQQELSQLHVLAPTRWVKATDHITEQIAFIQALEQRGMTYRTADGIYFDTSKQPGYGTLARLNRSGLHAGHRVALGEKHNPTDFALWKFSSAGTQRQMEWSSPWGVGFPGWHIECSAMSTKYLGTRFDIHAGGEDHVGVHHTNEIAQHEGRYGHNPANFWLHGAFLQVKKDDGQESKMSKSQGDVLRVATLVEQGYDPLAYRYLVLTAHYRSPLVFSWDALAGAQQALHRLHEASFGLGTPGERAAVFSQRILDAVNDDLNTARALAVVWELLKAKLPASVKKATLLYADQVLGLGLAEWKPAVLALPADVLQVLQDRAQARTAKQWTLADTLRQQLEAASYRIKDVSQGQEVWKGQARVVVP